MRDHSLLACRQRLSSRRPAPPRALRATDSDGTRSDALRAGGLGQGNDRRRRRLGIVERLELCGALLQHRLVHDRVAPVDAFRLVPDHFHGRGSGHARALEVPDGRPAEVVRDAARQTGGLTGRQPRATEGFDRPPGAVEQAWDDRVRGLLHRQRSRPLTLQHGPQGGGERELAPFCVLGLAWL
jgi:hypothetical protein